MYLVFTVECKLLFVGNFTSAMQWHYISEDSKFHSRFYKNLKSCMVYIALEYPRYMYLCPYEAVR